MWFSIGLLIASALLYVIHIIVRSFPIEHVNIIISLLMGTGMVGMILSVACFFMNKGMYDLKKRKKLIIWMIFSVAAFILFTGYVFVFCLVERAQMVGISF